MKNSGFTILVALVLVVGGYVLLMSPDKNAFGRVEIGDSRQQVIQRMGRPQTIESRRTLLHGVDYEYQYYLWPLQTRYCIGFKSDVVTDKRILDAR